MARDIQSIFNVPDRGKADALLKKAVARYAQDAPRLANWMEENLPQGLIVFAFLPGSYMEMNEGSQTLPSYQM